MPHKFDPKNIERLDNPERARWQSVERFLELLHPHERMNYADIGCGVGYFTLPVAERIGPHGRVYAVDIQPEMLAELERRARLRRLTNIIPVRCTEREIPIASASVDAACLANVFHELEDPLIFLREIHRVLKPGGRFFVIDWKPLETPMGPPLSERIPPKEVLQALRMIGFAQLREHEIYPYHYVIEVRSEEDQ
jgi:ubiquinone/menaquinone biosynthesis C-methylase UbiE